MKLPDNPFPVPYTVPNCVDDQPYPDKIRFIKRTLVGHLATIFTITLSAQYVHLPYKDTQLLTVLAVILIAMTALRLTIKSGKIEQTLSVILLLVAIPLLGQVCRDIYNSGYPILIFLIAATLTGLYTLLAGRDFSFPGMVTICSVALIPILLILRHQAIPTFESVAFTWIIGTIYLIYVAYNLSMILKRRIMTEVPTAIADFYRDSLNFLTYPVRVYFHWKHYQFQ
ncbi:MAG: hypothetical protein ACKVQS_05005 [Fimbriimonadaceae bacterium]